jgi:putative ABC transport system substrate-binding protein
MERRGFLGLVGAVAAWPLGALAQTPGRVYRLAHIANSAPSESSARQIIIPELARLGFVDGRNLIFDARLGESGALPGLMSELLAARPDAVIAVGGPAIAAAGAATRTVPIVTFGADPIELGFAASYARPGANVTGVVILASELEVKRLSILLEAAPDRRRVAVLTSPATAFGEAAMRKAAAGLGVELLAFPVTAQEEYPAAFAAMRSAGAQALVISATSEFYRHGKQLAALALENGLPTVCEWADMAKAGCLLGYGPDRVALRKRMAAQIAQIFRGTAAGDIAIERPTVFEFAVNQTVAKSLGLGIPSTVLTSASEVIE